MAQVEKIFENGIQVLGNSTIRDTSFLGLTTTSGTARVIQAQGNGSNIDITLTPKGTGVVNIPNIVTSGKIGFAASPTARLHLPAGTASAGTGPLKFTSGTLVTTIAGSVEDGLMEYNGTHLSIVIGSTRFQLDQQGGSISGLTINSIPYATSATTIGSDTALTWDPTNDALSIGGTNAIRIHVGAPGASNTFIGRAAGNFTASTTTATGIGESSLAAITSGSNIVAVGRLALSTITTGFNCTGLGAGALQNTTGNYNLGVGYSAGSNITTAAQCIVIGSDIQAQSATANGQLVIQNIIFGVNNTGLNTTISTGSIGIGEASPTRKLEVAGSLAIKAGASTGQIARVSGVIKTDTTTTGNVTTGEDVLQTYSILANTLATNGDTLVGTVSGTFTGSVNNKVIRIRFGSALIFEIPAYSNVATVSWAVRFEIIRTGSTTQKCNATIIIEDSLYVQYTTATETLSGAVTLQVTGEGTATNDIVKETFKLRWEPSE